MLAGRYETVMKPKSQTGSGFGGFNLFQDMADFT